MTDEKLEKAKLKHVEHNRIVYNENKELITMYEEYINRIVELFDFIRNEDNNLFHTIIFDILVEIGFFSADRVFDPEIENFKELTFKPGISIITGAGVCRNVSCFYDDVFKNFYDYPLKLCCFDQNDKQSDDAKTFGNHMINLTEYHDTLYGFDVLNHCLFRSVNANILSGAWFSYDLVHKPLGDLIMELATDLEVKSRFFDELAIKKFLMEKSAKKKVLTKEEFDKLVGKANEFIMERKKTLQSFLTGNQELTQEIKKKMLLLK